MRSKKEYKKAASYVRLLRSPKDSFFAISFAFLLCFFSMIGFFMDSVSMLSLNNLWGGVGIVFLLILLGAELYLRLCDLLINHISKERPEDSPADCRLYLCYLIIIMLMWFPVLLAYYPGIFAYDVDEQIHQTIGMYNTHHPLIHTLLLQFFYYIIGGRLFESYNKGMVCYTLFQMLILAMAIAYMHLFLYRMKMGRKTRIAILIFTGVFPVYSILSISMTKDIIFAAFVLVLFLCLCYWEVMPEFFEKKHLSFLYLFSIIGTVLFRKNGIYTLILLVIVSFLLLRGEKRKKFLFLSILGILLSVLLQGILKYNLHATEGTLNEMLSVPYQQLSYVYNAKQDELSPNDIYEIEDLIPNVKNYNIHNADAVKGDGQAWGHKRRFVFLYLKMFVKYPSAYVSAFLYNTMGYWYLFDTSNARIYGYGLENRLGYLLTDTKPGYDIVHNSYFPMIENLYENLFSMNEYQKFPLLFILCSMALYFWLLVLCGFYAINMKTKQAVIPITFLLSFLITILVGPCTLIRYFFPVISCLPPLFMVTFKSVDKNIN